MHPLLRNKNQNILNKIKGKFVISFILFILLGCGKQKDLNLKGPYLGQKPPGEKPELFAPGIISCAYDERMIFFTNQGKECFYQVRGVPHSVIFNMQFIQNSWTKPETAFFSGKYFEEFGISQDGNTIVFTSNRPFSNQGEPQKDFYVWKSIKVDGIWGEPKNLGENFKGAGYPTIANNGNIYFFDNGEDGLGKSDIYVSRFVEGKYLPAENLGDSINTAGYDIDPFIAPDESYLIYASDNKKNGLYISYKRSDGAWTKAIYLGDEIGRGESICPSVSSDGKFFFFTSVRRSHNGISTEYLSYEEKINVLNGPGNGSNDIYWVDASLIQENKPNF